MSAQSSNFSTRCLRNLAVVLAGVGALGCGDNIVTPPVQPAKYLVTVSNPSPVAGTSVTITAQAADANNNALSRPGLVVVWSASPTDGILSATSALTTADGRATATLTTSPLPGITHTVTATGGGLTGSSPNITTVGGPPISLVSLANGLGTLHSCAIASSGAAYCWGENGVWQLGRGDTIDREFPVPVSGNLIMSALSGGAYHTCGVTRDGAAYCWGQNGNGAVGDNSFVNRSTPVLVAGGLSFSSVSAGAYHTCGLTAGGAAYCWGSNAWGQLGIGVAAENRSSPVLVNGGLTFSSVTAGGSHSCGVTTSGAAYCWGYNSSGELGDDSRVQSSTPVLVLGSLNFTSVSVGDQYTCGVTAGGAAYCWGSNAQGQLGIGVPGGGRSTPSPVSGGLAFSSVAAGPGHSCSVTTTGAAYCWGSNVSGELGNGTYDDSPTPVAVGGGFQFRSVSAGGVEFVDYYYYGSYFLDHTCGITAAGIAYCWGSNEWGQLGSGKTVLSSSLPRKVGGQP